MTLNVVIDNLPSARLGMRKKLGSAPAVLHTQERKSARCPPFQGCLPGGGAPERLISASLTGQKSPKQVGGMVNRTPSWQSHCGNQSALQKVGSLNLGSGVSDPI